MFEKEAGGSTKLQISFLPSLGTLIVTDEKLFAGWFYRGFKAGIIRKHSEGFKARSCSIFERKCQDSRALFVHEPFVHQTGVFFLSLNQNLKGHVLCQNLVKRANFFPQMGKDGVHSLVSTNQPFSFAVVLCGWNTFILQTCGPPYSRNFFGKHFRGHFHSFFFRVHFQI